MQVSAEVRWFWPSRVPSAVEAWFRGGPLPPGGGRFRDDVYLRDPEQPELGIKRRGGKPGLEIKGLVALLPPIACGKLVARAELWSKWTSTALELPAAKSMIARKTRWLRKYDLSTSELVEVQLAENEAPADPAVRLPALGCNVELTQVVVDENDLWWTLGFEAFGQYDNVEVSLRRAVEHAAGMLDVGGGQEMSYPTWLQARSKPRRIQS